MNPFKSVYERYMTWYRAKLESLSPDGRGWLICLAVLILTVVRSGLTYSFGEFVVQLQKQYHRPMAEQNWIGTLSFTVSLVSAPLSVALIRYTGHGGYRKIAVIGCLILTVSCVLSSLVIKLEWMFLTHSFMYGVGSSMLLMTSSLIIGEYFDKTHKKHVLATSILLCGYPVGSLLFNPINAWLVNAYGWRVGFRVTSVLIFITGAFCCSLYVSKRSKEEYEEDCAVFAKDPSQWFTMQQVRRRPEIVLWLFGNMLVYIGFYMPFLNLAYYMKLKGIAIPDGSWALTLLSLFECISYVIASLLGDFLKGKLVYANVIASASLAVICFIWPFVDVNYTLILLIAGAMGIFLGLNIVYSYAASGEVTQLAMDVAWAATNVWSGLGILTGPLFSGVIFDVRKNYDDVFYVSGGIYTLCTLTFCCILFLRHVRHGSSFISEYCDLEEEMEETKTKDYGSAENINSNDYKNYSSTFQGLRASISKDSLVKQTELGNSVPE